MKTRIRIMFVIHDMSSGGAERKVNNIVRHLDSDRFDVHLILHRMDIAFPLPEALPTYELGLRHPIQTLKAIRKLRQLIGETQPDLLVSGALNPALLCAEAVRPMAKRPKCVALVANNPQREPGWRQPWAKRSYRIFDYFISSCEGLRTIFLETYSFVRPEQILLWNTPVDIERSVRKAGEPTDKAGSTRASLIALGRLCEQKRFDVLLEAFALVRKKQQVDLLILGEGPLRQRLEQQAAAIGVYDSVYMPGFSANPYPALNEADVYIMSSDFEGLPNALLEAQALGVPVVTTDCPTGPSDIIAEGETGLLIECGDPKALAGEVLKLLEDHELRKKMKEAARKRVSEHFDVHVCMPKLEALLETIAALP